MTPTYKNKTVIKIFKILKIVVNFIEKSLQFMKLIDRKAFNFY